MRLWQSVQAPMKAAGLHSDVRLSQSSRRLAAAPSSNQPEQQPVRKLARKCPQCQSSIAFNDVPYPRGSGVTAGDSAALGGRCRAVGARSLGSGLLLYNTHGSMRGQHESMGRDVCEVCSARRGGLRWRGLVPKPELTEY